MLYLKAANGGVRIIHCAPSSDSRFCDIVPPPVPGREHMVRKTGVLASFGNRRKCLRNQSADGDSAQKIMLNCQAGVGREGGGGGAEGEMGEEQMEWGETRVELEN